MALSAPAPRRSALRRWLLLATLLILIGLMVGLWFWLPVRQVVVSGNTNLTAQQVQRLAGLTPPFTGKRPGGWLYYGAWRAGALAKNPWILSARIVKRFPDRIELSVTERVPAAQLLRAGHPVALAWDGTVLPNGPLKGPLIQGWGPSRLADALRAAQLLARYNVQSVTYTPQGLTIKTAQGTVWSGAFASLRKYGGSVKMYPGQRINIYPWGVSVQQ